MSKAVKRIQKNYKIHERLYAKLTEIASQIPDENGDVWVHEKTMRQLVVRIIGVTEEIIRDKRSTAIEYGKDTEFLQNFKPLLAEPNQTKTI